MKRDRERRTGRIPSIILVFFMVDVMTWIYETIKRRFFKYDEWWINKISIVYKRNITKNHLI